MSRDTARKVLEIEARAILDLVSRIDGSFDRAVEALLACTGRVVVTGLGKSGIIAQKLSATFASTPALRKACRQAGWPRRAPRETTRGSAPVTPRMTLVRLRSKSRPWP